MEYLIRFMHSSDPFVAIAFSVVAFGAYIALAVEAYAVLSLSTEATRTVRTYVRSRYSLIAGPLRQKVDAVFALVAYRSVKAQVAMMALAYMLYVRAGGAAIDTAAYATISGLATALSVALFTASVEPVYAYALLAFRRDPAVSLSRGDRIRTAARGLLFFSLSISLAAIVLLFCVDILRLDAAGLPNPGPMSPVSYLVQSLYEAHRAAADTVATTMPL